MKPLLLELFGIPLPAYFVFLTTGLALATWMSSRLAHRVGYDREVVIDLGLAMSIAGVLGARVLHVLADGHFWDYVHACTDPSLVDWHVSQRECLSRDLDGVWDAAKSVCHPRERNCFAWAAFWAGGLTYYGGLIGASAYAVYFLRREGFPFWKAADITGWTIAFGLVWGRMGCFLGGCCFGSVCELPWAAVFPANSPASEHHALTHRLPTAHVPSLPVHPAQLYEALGCLAIAMVTYLVVLPRKRYDGQAFLFFLVSYGVLRTSLEYLREDERGGVWAFSTSQWISLGLIAAAVPMARWLRAQSQQSNTVPA